MKKKLTTLLTYLAVAALAVLASEAKADGVILLIDPQVMIEAEKEAMESFSEDEQAELKQIKQTVLLLSLELREIYMIHEFTGEPDSSWDPANIEIYISDSRTYILNTEELVGYYESEPYRTYVELRGYDADMLIEALKRDIERVQSQLQKAEEIVPKANLLNSI